MEELDLGWQSYNSEELIMKRKIVYFPGLDSIRFLAAFAVIVHHTEQIKSIYKLPNYFQLPIINIIGGLGVTLFFVLSGFLITYLLLEEKKEFHSISLKGFYMRRILRIWPLYYLIVILGFFIFPYIIPVKEIPSVLESNFREKFLLFIFLVPNLSLQFYPVVPFIAPLWSVGVEEQFYLVWPILIKYFKTMLLSILLFLVFSVSFLRYLLPFSHNVSMLNLGTFFEYFRIDCMAIGGMFAYFLARNISILLKVIYSKYFQVLGYLLLIICLSNGLVFPFYQTAYSVMFGLLILNISSNPTSILKLEWKPFNWLGKISYGLYVFHGAIIFLFFYFFKYTVASFENPFLREVFTYSAILSSTIFISYLSYHFYERIFLREKRKYTFIKSGSL